MCKWQSLIRYYNLQSVSNRLDQALTGLTVDVEAPISINLAGSSAILARVKRARKLGVGSRGKP